jgi:RsiW-degrading membrane proteinase PrsW (M82 family)
LLEYQFVKIMIAGLLALLPALFWGYLFFIKQPHQKRLVIHLFLAGAVSVAPLLAYKFLWQYFPWINAFLYTNSFADDFVGFANVSLLPLDVLVTFMIVGIIEEVAKFQAVRLIHKKKVCSVTDVMEYFIIVALGFAFIENIIYFYNIINIRGAENIFLPFIFRSLFSTFAHLMFSGILGYYYGQSLLAKPLLKENYNQKKWSIIRTIAKTLKLNKEKLFAEEKLIQGLLAAIILHACFNIFLEMNWTFFIIPFLGCGFIVLNNLFDNRQVDKDYCLIETT